MHVVYLAENICLEKNKRDTKYNWILIFDCYSKKGKNRARTISTRIDGKLKQTRTTILRWDAKEREELHAQNKGWAKNTH